MSLNTRYGINLKNLVDAVKKYESVDSASSKEKILVYICKNLLRTIQYNRYINNKSFNFLSKKHLNSDEKKSYVESRMELNKMLSITKQETTKSVSNKSNKKKRSVPNFVYDYNQNMNRAKTHSNLKSKAIKQQSNTSTKKSSISKKRIYEDIKSNYLSIQKRVNFKSNQETDESQSEATREYLPSDRQAIKRKYLIIKAGEKPVNENNFKHPFKIIKKHVTDISKKHAFNFLSSGYGVNSNEDLNLSASNSELSNFRIKSNKSNIILINNAHLKALLESEQKNKPLDNTKEASISNCSPKCLIPNLSENYLTRLYLFVKIFYLLSTVGQFLLLWRLIGNGYEMIGINLVKSFFYETEWPHLAVFPRMTLCEIYIREIGVVHPYLIQCVLSINLFNEVIFICIWYWLLFLVILISIDLLMRFVCNLLSCSNCKRKLFTLKYLELIHMSETKHKNENISVSLNEESIKSNNNYIFLSVDKYAKLFKLDKEKSLRESDIDLTQNYGKKYSVNNKNILLIASKDEEHELFEKFCANFNSDTIFALNVIRQNASSLIVSEIIEHLWAQFKRINFVFSNEANDFFLKKIIFLNDSTN